MKRFFQEKPQRVLGKLPAKALCLICSQNGESEEEKPAGAVAYQGKTYYFCNRGEVEKFLKDPETYLPAPVPRPAPSFVLKAVTGERVTPETFKGKVLLVDFWATWCVPCVKAMPELQKLQERYASRNFSVVGIALDEEGMAKVGPFLAKSKVKYTYPLLLNTGDNWKQWGVKSLPTLLLVKDGQVLKHWSGKIDLKDVEQALRAAL